MRQRCLYPLALLLSVTLLCATFAGASGLKDGVSLPSAAERLSLLVPAASGDGFLVINASSTPSAATSNLSRVAFSLVPNGAARFSSVAPSRSDPSVVEVVVAYSNQRLALLGLIAGDQVNAVVYARELVTSVGALGGVAVDWRRRRAFFAENGGSTVRVVSLDLPSGPVPLKELPVLVQLPYVPYGGSLLSDLVLDADHDVLYLGSSIKADSSHQAAISIWSFRSDGSDLNVARNLSTYSYSPAPPVMALSSASGKPARLLALTVRASTSGWRFFDLTTFDLPLTPESGNGTVISLSAVTDDPTGLVVDDTQGWLFVADRTRGVTRLRINGTDFTSRFVQLASDEPLVAIGLVPPPASRDNASLIINGDGGGRLLVFGAKRGFYAAPLQPPVNLTVLAEALSNQVMGLTMDPASCRMWYLDGGRLMTRQANDWRPAVPQITPYTYATSNLAIDTRNQLYFARNFPETGQILGVDGNLHGGGGNMSVLVSSFGLKADGNLMATDPVGRKLYYFASFVIFRSELDGSNRIVYARTRPATSVSSFVLDLKQRLLYYTEGNRPGCDVYHREIDAPDTSKPVLVYSSPLSRRYPPVSLASDPVNRVLYSLECSGTQYRSCSLYSITLRSPASDSSSTLLASFYTRLPTRIQLDPQHETLFLSDTTGKTLWRCPLARPGSNLTCFDLHLNPHTRLVAIAVDAPRSQLYAIDKPSYTVVRFDLAEPDAPQPNLGNAFEVLHQLREEELPVDNYPQHMQIDPDSGLLYVRTTNGIGRGVMHHARPAPYSPIEPLINDSSVVAFTLDPLRQRIHWMRSKGASSVYQIGLWSSAMDGSDARLLADWSSGSPCGAGLPIALHLDPPAPANASVLPPAFWAVWSTSTVCHWNGTVMRRVASISNYGRVRSTAYDADLQRVYLTGTYWQDVPTIFVVDVIKATSSMWKQEDSADIDGIAASATGGELYSAQLASRSAFYAQPTVYRWRTSSGFVKRAEVLRSVPPATALIDMQHPERPVYFIDREGATVWTARSDGTGQRLTHRPIRGEYVNASAFWVDSTLQVFYWTETLRLDTRAAHLESLDRVTTVLLVPVANTKSVVVDDVRGWMYWSDASQGRVMRAHLDGSGVECFWTGAYYEMAQTTLQAVEPVTGDLIVTTFIASEPRANVQRRSLATGDVSTLLSVRLGLFSPLSGLAAVQLDPRTDADGCSQRLWVGAAVKTDRSGQGFIGTACAGATAQVTRLVDLPGAIYAPWLMQLLPDLSHCLPPSGLDA